ncbi:hypothetical protein Pan241w_10350 [Gimesia alba]|uniref:Uncharacterized protein n=1 Tax=Gimesia alba TaxID=2527973 RepID=A0A517RAR0_9PLAN|nr:hypothetical protein Pan241w_10350 [Gimesia alba]
MDLAGGSGSQDPSRGSFEETGQVDAAGSFQNRPADLHVRGNRRTSHSLSGPPTNSIRTSHLQTAGNGWQIVGTVGLA